jgi:hypothetical protein
MSGTLATPPPLSALPPGPISPAWWQLYRFAGDPLGLLDECHRRYGDVEREGVAGKPRRGNRRILLYGFGLISALFGTSG